MLTKILEQLEAYSSLKENSLLLFDDVTACLKDKAVQKLLALIIANRRHLKCSVLLLVQWYNSIPLNLRKQINVLIMFAPKNMKEMKNIAEELTKYEHDRFRDVIEYVFDRPYMWLLIDRDDNTLWKCFNRLEVEDK